VVGNTTVLASVKYVITLDTDTQLPRDAAQQFVGAMAHPLNRPLYGEAKRRSLKATAFCNRAWVISLPGTNRSRYARLYGGEPGIDPYTRAVSDVYQDVFGEGVICRQGNLRRRCVRASHWRMFPRDLILSPRPSGRLLRPCRAVEQCESL